MAALTSSYRYRCRTCNREVDAGVGSEDRFTCWPCHTGFDVNVEVEQVFLLDDRWHAVVHLRTDEQRPPLLHEGESATLHIARRPG